MSEIAEKQTKDKQSIETRAKISKRLIGHVVSKQTREKIKEARKRQVFPVKDTKIEVKIQDFLKELGIEFVPHKYIGIKYGYQCDIFIPTQKGISKKTVIECDGDYWHGNLDIFPISKLNKDRLCKRCLDFERTVQLEEVGYNVIRLWEHEINKMDSDGFQDINVRAFIQCHTQLK